MTLLSLFSLFPTLILLLLVTFLLFASPSLPSVSSQNTACAVVVPTLPLSAIGLSTPYLLHATDPNAGPCNQLTVTQTAFVQGMVFDPVASVMYVYNPLVIDLNTKAFIAPVVPLLPTQSIVALWFGFNGNVLTLLDNGAGSLAQGVCTQGGGADQSQFGTFAYCNAVAFFSSANNAIAAGALIVPTNGNSPLDGKPCPTLRDWTMGDENPADQVDTSYLVNTATMQLAQNTPQNALALGITPTTLVLGQNFLQNQVGDSPLLSQKLLPALQCQPWAVRDLASQAQGTPQMLTSNALSQLHAAANQLPPVALVFNNDPMTRITAGTVEDIQKVSSYRVGVNQPTVNVPVESDSINACNRYLSLAPARIMADSAFTQQATSPNPLVAKTLFGFLVQRVNNAVMPTAMNCVGLLNIPPPFVFQTANGQVVDLSVALNTGATIPPLQAVNTRTNPLGQILLTGNPVLDSQQGNADVGAPLPSTSTCRAAFSGGGFNGTWFGVGFILATGGAILLAGLSLILKSKNMQNTTNNTRKSISSPSSNSAASSSRSTVSMSSASKWANDKQHMQNNQSENSNNNNINTVSAVQTN